MMNVTIKMKMCEKADDERVNEERDDEHDNGVLSTMMQAKVVRYTRLQMIVLEDILMKNVTMNTMVHICEGCYL